MKDIVFDLFRFQLLPKSTHQLKLFEETISFEDLKIRKNNFFAEALLGANVFYNRSKESLRHRILFSRDDVIVLKIGRKRSVVLTNSDFEDEQHEDFPSVYVVINNSPNNQRIAISRDSDAFTESFVVANILEENFTRFCQIYNLEVVINPILDSADFWELINRYEDRIIQIKFNLVRPNLANISGTFKDEIRQLTDSTNSLSTKVELNAPKDSALENINEENPRLKALADYAIQGGSQFIHMKVKGIKRTIKTEKTITTVSIDAAELSGDPKSVYSTFEQLTRED